MQSDIDAQLTNFFEEAPGGDGGRHGARSRPGWQTPA